MESDGCDQVDISKEIADTSSDQSNLNSKESVSVQTECVDQINESIEPVRDSSEVDKKLSKNDDECVDESADETERVEGNSIDDDEPQEEIAESGQCQVKPQEDEEDGKAHSNSTETEDKTQPEEATAEQSSEITAEEVQDDGGDELIESEENEEKDQKEKPFEVECSEETIDKIKNDEEESTETPQEESIKEDAEPDDAGHDCEVDEKCEEDESDKANAENQEKDQTVENASKDDGDKEKASMSDENSNQEEILDDADKEKDDNIEYVDLDKDEQSNSLENTEIDNENEKNPLQDDNNKDDSIDDDPIAADGFIVENQEGADEELCIIPDTERVLSQAEKEAASSIPPLRDLSEASVSNELPDLSPPIIATNKFVVSKCNSDNLENCLKCLLKRKANYSVVKDDTTQFICSDSCFDNFKSDNVDGYVLNWGEGEIRVKNLTNTEKVTSVQLNFERKCIVCKSTTNDEENNLTWEIMDFCNEFCLSKYQKEIGSVCSSCTNQVRPNSLGKYCVRFGNDIRQFCTSHCLEEYKKGLKVCSYCQQDMSGGSDGFLAPVGDKGQFKDFCSQQCMEKYDVMTNNRPPKVAEGTKCSVCKTDNAITIEFDQQGSVNYFCSDRCFVAFSFVNNIAPSKCSMCRRYFPAEILEKNTMFYDNVQYSFCSNSCQNIYIIAHRKIVPCVWCKVKKYNFDMIRRYFKAGPVLNMCSINCLSLFQVSVNAVNSKKTICNFCNKRHQPMYHLTMSDATIRNFCSYACVMSFQNKFKKSPITLNSDDQPVPTGEPKKNRKFASESAAKTVTSTAVASPSPPLPVISSVQSLASKTAANTTTTATAKTNKTTTVAQTEQPIKIKHHIIIKPPPIPDQRNVATMCKLRTHNKTTLMKPSMENQAVQTDEREAKKILIPVPVPIYIPSPLPMYSIPVPYPLPFPIPIPIPIFIPTTRNSAEGIMKEIKKIQVKIPTDPYEAELLMMAEMVAGDKKEDNTDSESDVDDAAGFNCVGKMIRKYNDMINDAVITIDNEKYKLRRPIGVPRLIQCGKRVKFHFKRDMTIVQCTTVDKVGIRDEECRNKNSVIHTGNGPDVSTTDQLICGWEGCDDTFMFRDLPPGEASVVVEKKQTKRYVWDNPIKKRRTTKRAKRNRGRKNKTELIAAPSILPNGQNDLENPDDTGSPAIPRGTSVVDELFEQSNRGHSGETGSPDEGNFSPETVDASNTFGDDMLQMALKMATELEEPAVDLEGALTASTITAPQGATETANEEQVDDPQPQIVQMNERQSSSNSSSSSRGRKRGSRGGRGATGKRRRTSQPVDVPVAPAQPLPPAEPVEKPDAHLCLKYTFGVNAWKQWVATKNAELEKSTKYVKPFKTEILQLTSDELNYSLVLFVKEVRKPNGAEYAPDTIYYLCLGIQQYLFENNRIDNIFCDPYYEQFTDSLDEIARKFSILYNDSHYIVTRVEEEHLWESKQLGAHSPHVLLSTLMFFNTKHFNLTTVQEHMQLSFSHIMKHWKRNPNQTGAARTPGSRNVLLRFYPPQSTVQNNTRKKKVYEQQENDENPLRCPVKLYEFYLSKCPESVKTRNDVFYLQPERSCVPDSPVWYSTTALAQEALEKMLHRVKMVKEINVALLTS